MISTLRTLAIGIGLATTIAACSNYKESGGQDYNSFLESEAAETIAKFKETDDSIKNFFDSSYGYAVFPKVTKGAAGIGAAHGDGVVYQAGSVIGFADLTQASIGLQLGGQTYREIIFFEDESVFESFKADDVEFSANASAVAAESGAAAAADYEAGVAVFTMTRSGLMFEASIGGQKFDFEPKE